MPFLLKKPFSLWFTTRRPTPIHLLCHHGRARSRPAQSMPMRLSDFEGDAYITVCIGQIGGGRIRLIVGFQPLMVISPTASWIRWCMQVYVWWFNVDLSCLGRTVYARQFLGAKPPINSSTGEAERNHSDHLYWLLPCKGSSGMITSLGLRTKSRPQAD